MAFMGGGGGGGGGRGETLPVSGAFFQVSVTMCMERV